MFNVPAEFYDRFVGRYSASLGDELIAFAGIQPGMRVLDVGCGPGGLTRRLVDLGCTVTGCDPSETFAAAAAERVPEAEIVRASAEDLPFEDASFDAVLAQLVVNFMADPEAGAREMARVTSAGRDGRRLRLGLRRRDDADAQPSGTRRARSSPSAEPPRTRP